MARRREWVPVAAWEIRRVMQRKDFLFSVALLPVLMLGSIFVVAWVKRNDERQVRRVAVVRVAAPGDAAGAGAATLPALRGFEWQAPPPQERSLEALVAAVRAKRYEGAVLLPAGYAREESTRYVVLRAGAAWARDVRKHLGMVGRVERALGRPLTGAEQAAFEAPLGWTETVALPDQRSSRTDRVVGAALVMLMLTSLFVTNSYLAIGISGEKQARVTEVIVSAIRPQSWMDGKLVAYIVIGLAQTGLWAISLLALAVFMVRALPPAVNPALLSVFLAFTALGFAFYVALNALILATIKDLQSTSKFQAYLFFLPAIPIIFLESVIDNPDSVTHLVLSLLPPFAPMLMPARLALGGAAWWEVAVALVLLALGCHFMRRAAGQAFRIGMLMYGKEVNLPELWRWAKET